MPRPICVNCNLEMTRKKTRQVTFTELHHVTVWRGEQFECSCGNRVVAAFSSTGIRQQKDSGKSSVEISD